MRKIIKIKQLKFKYLNKQKLNENFSLNIDKFELLEKQKTAIIGESGSGKSTFVKLLAGILKSNGGSISVLDKQIDNMSESQRRDFRSSNIGFVFQDFGLISYLNALDNIRLPFLINKNLQKNTSRKIISRAEQLAEYVGITKNVLRRNIGQFSGGEKQRIAICRALINMPKIIIADEISGNLDEKNAENVLKILFEKTTEYSAALLLITHDKKIEKNFQNVLKMNELNSAK